LNACRPMFEPPSVAHGIVSCTHTYQDPSRDQALYQAKRDGGNCVRIF
jgi:hypothetical protein